MASFHLVGLFLVLSIVYCLDVPVVSLSSLLSPTTEINRLSSSFYTFSTVASAITTHSSLPLPKRRDTWSNSTVAFSKSRSAYSSPPRSATTPQPSSVIPILQSVPGSMNSNTLPNNTLPSNTLPSNNPITSRNPGTTTLIPAQSTPQQPSSTLTAVSSMTAQASSGLPATSQVSSPSTTPTSQPIAVNCSKDPDCLIPGFCASENVGVCMNGSCICQSTKLTTHSSTTTAAATPSPTLLSEVVYIQWYQDDFGSNPVGFRGWLQMFPKYWDGTDMPRCSTDGMVAKVEIRDNRPALHSLPPPPTINATAVIFGKSGCKYLGNGNGETTFGQFACDDA